MNAPRQSFVVVIIISSALALPACRKSDSAASSSSSSPPASDSSGGGSGGAPSQSSATSGIDREARDAALAEIQKHWTKSADGWTTAKITGTSFAADHYLRQIREITIESVEPNTELTEADRLNGFEWAGQINFKKSPCREAGDPGIVLDGTADVTVNRPRGRWSQWIDYLPEPLRLQKVKGKWQIPQDTWFLRGALPTPADYTKAGVK